MPSSRKPDARSGGARKPRRSKSQDLHPSVAPYRQKERGERLQKVLADAGVAARRECEKLILDGAVTVNGKSIDTLPAWVDPDVDRIEVYGRPLRKAEQHVYLMLFKPRGTVCTNSDPEGRPRAIDLVDHPARTRLYCVGRLDLDASGLILLTNDGEFANRLTHPRYEVPKGYDLTVDGRVDDASIAEIERKLLGKHARRAEAAGATRVSPVVPARAAAKEPGGAPAKPRGTGAARRASRDEAPQSAVRPIAIENNKSVIHLELCEHRNLSIKEVLRTLGHPVRRMRRTSFGPLRLKGLAVGEWRELTPQELDLLKRKPQRSAGVATAKPGTGKPSTGKPSARKPGTGKPTLRRTPSKSGRPGGDAKAQRGLGRTSRGESRGDHGRGGNRDSTVQGADRSRSSARGARNGGARNGGARNGAARNGGERNGGAKNHGRASRTKRGGPRR